MLFYLDSLWNCQYICITIACQFISLCLVHSITPILNVSLQRLSQFREPIGFYTRICTESFFVKNAVGIAYKRKAMIHTTSSHLIKDGMNVISAIPVEIFPPRLWSIPKFSMISNAPANSAGIVSNRAILCKWLVWENRALIFFNRRNNSGA